MSAPFILFGIILFLIVAPIKPHDIKGRQFKTTLLCVSVLLIMWELFLYIGGK